MKLKSLEYYLDNREELLRIFLQVTEPERLLLPTCEFLQMLHPVEWRDTEFGYPLKRTALSVPEGLKRLYYDEFPSSLRHYSYIRDYCSFMRHLYGLVQARLQER